ncbi:hypothetical protein RhiirB3_412114, partial [Rhizophagus irregularis]
MIDEFIQYTQLNANDSTDYLEWIENLINSIWLRILINGAFLVRFILQYGWKDQLGIWAKKLKYGLVMVQL